MYCLKKKNYSYFNNKHFYFFLFFWIYLIINTLINNFNLDSLKISFFYFRYGVFVIAIIAFLNEDDRFIKYFFYCIFICFFALTLDGIYQYFNTENIFGWKSSSRTSSFFGEEKILGSYLSRLWPIFFGLSILILNQRDKIFYLSILLFILTEVIIFLSGDRTAFFYLNLSAIFIIIFSKKLYKLRLFTLIISIILLVLISLIKPTAKERVIDRTLKEMNLNSIFQDTNSSTNKNQNQNQNQNQIYIFTKQHTTYYLTAYKMYLDNKFLGVGVKNYRNFCNNKNYASGKAPCSNHPHNTYVQILSETGLIGFSFLFFLLIYFIKYVLKHAFLKFSKRYYFNDFEICLLSGIAIYLWPLAPTGNVFSNWLNILLILYLPFIVWSRNPVKITKKL
ncbi:O-antigen ligase family protein [Candidatus Pelagibacter sp. HIMB1485]|uniref:O-antigen ligase family protein n=1 Tax=Candidatus Pelagibacter sp. HIMB1485 TaxID=3415415 RepID=UPI003F85B733